MSESIAMYKDEQAIAEVRRAQQRVIDWLERYPEVRLIGVGDHGDFPRDMQDLLLDAGANILDDWWTYLNGVLTARGPAIPEDDTWITDDEEVA